MTPAIKSAALSDHRHVLLRAMIWAMVGVIYVPLFLALDDLFKLTGLGVWSLVPAAALAGGAGAMLYGARQVAIAASLIGVSTGSLLLLIPEPGVALWEAALVGLLAGMAGGFYVHFPTVCTSHVVAKAVAGMMSGALCGVALAFSVPLLPEIGLDVVIVAFVVSVNGMIYITTLGFWVNTLARIDAVANQWKQALVIGVVAMLTAASVWVVAKSIGGAVDSPMASVLMGLPDRLPATLLVGAMAGAITGALLELFRFRWVLDV